MAQKETIVTTIKDDGLTSGLLAREVATFTPLPAPGTVEESLLTIATYCMNCQKILDVFEGVALLDYALRGGQRSAVGIGIVLSSIEKKPDDPV